MFNFRNSIFNNENILMRRVDMANSPFHKAIFETEQRRSQLFPDRRRIPGRKAKFLFALAIVMQVWGLRKLNEIRNF